ncbi:MAG: prepilin-type N-terminal cleavage/methylation domain-containing protein [Elusimicrobiaceae bacterium]|nr:prepilin-type N-terminal cleavage/methylation domain-containing protein [Elusimicrobiaceae bacterium]
MVKENRNVKGFTLIELLVVVFIIGILASIALPQYQKAVMKSRYANLKSLTRVIANAQEVYYLANGVYAKNFDELSVDLPTGGTHSNLGDDAYSYPWGECALSIGNTEQVVYCQDTKIKMRLQIYYEHSPSLPGVSVCVAKNEAAALSSPQNQICKAETNRANYFTYHENLYATWKY